MAVFAVLAGGLRFSIGLVFLASGVSKLRDPASFVRGVDDYHVLPRRRRLPQFVAAGVICAELLAGGALVTGRLLWLAAAVACGLGTAFVVAIAVNLRRDRRLRCHCFGASELLSRRSLLRAGMLVGGSVAVLAASLAGLDLTAGVLSAVTWLQVTVGLTLLAAASWILTLPELRRILRPAPAGSGVRP